ESQFVALPDPPGRDVGIRPRRLELLVGRTAGVEALPWCQPFSPEMLEPKPRIDTRACSERSSPNTEVLVEEPLVVPTSASRKVVHCVPLIDADWSRMIPILSGDASHLGTMLGLL